MTKLDWNRKAPKTPTADIIYLIISYHQREEVKKLGAKWDVKLKLWYTLSSNPNVKKLRSYMHKDDMKYK
jgi:hypothetical protein